MKFYFFWNLFQYLLGGNFEKKKCIKKFLKPNHLKVLEIGCATGILSTIFQRKNIQYYGIDIDKEAIEFAKNKYSSFKNIKFISSDLKILLQRIKFNLILIPGVLHHCSDNEVNKLFETLVSNIKDSNNVDIYIAEPRKISKKSNYFNIFFLKFFERGKFLRSKKNLNKLLSNYVIVKKNYYFRTCKFFSNYSSHHDVLFGKLKYSNK
jgi:2-polyprenyl-3-methyl-5-hydroxy-6-metoxy-1,4-benzoquinol methylase